VEDDFHFERASESRIQKGLSADFADYAEKKGGKNAMGNIQSSKNLPRGWYFSLTI
jgi:hypothetical protein